MDALTPPDGISSQASVKTKTPVGNQGLYFIAVFNLVKGVLFLIVAAGVFHLINRSTPTELLKLLHAFRLSGDGKIVKSLLLKANVITDPNKWVITRVLFVYAVLYFTEGIGLLLRKRWAEYLTVIMTAIPLPFEIFVLLHHPARTEIKHLVPADQSLPGPFSSHVFVMKVAALIINVGILWYLIYHLRRSARHGLTPPSSVTPARRVRRKSL